MEEFARKEYASYILVDFSKVNPQVMEFFNLYLDDLDMLFMNLELYFRRKLTPRQTKDEEARSLVIFDEVQFCPRARAAIKHLVADRRYDYIETGSLISINPNRSLEKYAFFLSYFCYFYSKNQALNNITSYRNKHSLTIC